MVTMKTRPLRVDDDDDMKPLVTLFVPGMTLVAGETLVDIDDGDGVGDVNGVLKIARTEEASVIILVIGYFERDDSYHVVSLPSTSSHVTVAVLFESSTDGGQAQHSTLFEVSELRIRGEQLVAGGNHVHGACDWSLTFFYTLH